MSIDDEFYWAAALELGMEPSELRDALKAYEAAKASGQPVERTTLMGLGEYKLREKIDAAIHNDLGWHVECDATARLRNKIMQAIQPFLMGERRDDTPDAVVTQLGRVPRSGLINPVTEAAGSIPADLAPTSLPKRESGANIHFSSLTSGDFSTINAAIEIAKPAASDLDALNKLQMKLLVLARLATNEIEGGGE